MVQRCRILNLSVTAVIVLSIYNVLLTVKLMYNKDDCPHVKIQHVVSQSSAPPKPPCNSQVNDISTDTVFSKLDLKLGRWDNKLIIKYFDNFLVGDRYSQLNEDFTVCLATQSSIEKLSSLVEVSSTWHGAISTAVYAAGDDELNLILLYLIYLRQCFVNIKNRVSFHLAVPKGRMPKSIQVDLASLAQMDCNRPDVTLQQLLKRRSAITAKWRIKNPYPQNHLRNLARKNCHSGHVFLTDVDIVPSDLLAEKLDGFLKKASCTKLCAYVIPTYELDNRIRFPPNKTELVRLASKGLARPFHHKVFIYNQFATNFSKWQTGANEESQEVHISHPVTNFEFLYEPFYVAPDTAPPHDERFIGYGYTRNTQVYEMYVAGYEFLVLSPIFTVHWGLQVKRSRPPWREHQNNQNRKLFDTFKREVFAKYKKDPLHMVANSHR
ncbi:PREDICTED: beta-1,4-glucuronyltransferase 1 [Nicrophorus vespilloides]|uniref:Beta-1,4-glucuronyltransferase 1 n=1 Tax=Nicrophorus vespilloides TaxID=110193 RepID=A0ABM1MH40_NICVS|nr:PREDICTED: beta-1,4-glucuronyltransferase 1 [Nicrophorus vespilloides]